LSNVRVRKEDGSIESFDKNKIIESIRKETGCVGKIIEEIVDEVYTTLKVIRLDPVTGPLIREFINTKFLEHGMDDCRRKYTRVGMPVYDARKTDLGYGKGDNANLNSMCPETGHKRKADQLSKEQYLLSFPNYISEAHLNGDVHIHDLEYFGNRIFCQDHDMRYFFKHGFIGDGTGHQTSIAGPAMRPEVAILHAVKVLGSAQTNCMGGQGLMAFLTFLSPYFKNEPYKVYTQCMQELCYELTQMLVARGGQSTRFDEVLVIKDDNNISLIKIGEFCHKYLSEDGTYIFDGDEKKYEILSLNRKTGTLEWKKINGVYVHKSESQLKETTLSDGRSVVTTSDHSLFTLDDNCNIVEITPSERPNTILTVKNIPFAGKPFDKDLMFLIGACIGDGNLYANNGIYDSAININVSSVDVYKRIQSIVKSYGVSDCVFKPVNGSCNLYHSQFQTTGIPYITEIGYRAPNKKIPDVLLSGDDESLYELLNGLISTDGDVSRRRYEYNTTSKKLAIQIEFILRRLGLDYSISSSMKSSNFKRNYPVYVIRISASCSSNIKITNLSRHIESLNGPNQQKHDFRTIKPLLKQYLGRGFYRFGHSELLANNRKLKREHIEDLQESIPDIWNKVKNILPMEVKLINSYPDEEFVYDIGVDDNENFVLHNGIICHNTVFSSVQLTPGVPDIWKNVPAVYKGKLHDGEESILDVYGNYEKEVRLLFKAIMEVMIEGDYAGKPFYFPKPEITLEESFIQNLDNEVNDAPTYRDLYIKAFELASKFGTPYFDNLLPSWRKTGGIECYQCCAYRFTSDSDSDDFNDKLNFVNGNHFSMGAMQVMTINFPRLAYIACSENNGINIDLYFENLCKKQIDLCCDVFLLKSKMVGETKASFLQQVHGGKILVDFKDLVYTIGVIGMNEVCEILYGANIYVDNEVTKKAMKFVMKMKDYCAEKSNELGITIAFARTPAETTAQRFAVLDLLNYGDAHKFVKGDVKEAIKKYAETGSRDLPIYYTNGTHCPVDADIALSDKIKIEQAFFPILDGGNICHIFLGEAAPDPRGLMDMTLKICKSTNLGYFAFTKDFTICNNGYRYYD
jgi:ribonucleoside-triphosphate reductase